MNAKTLGRYRILGELGRGAMRAVFRAIDPLIEREIDATNVRRIGKVRGRIPAAAITEMADELARYALGVDSDFAKRLTAV